MTPDTFTLTALSLSDAGNIDGLESLLDEAVAARIECRADAPTTPQFNRAAELLKALRKERAA